MSKAPPGMPPDDREDGQAASLLPNFDNDRAVELFSEDPSKGLSYVVDQFEQQAGAAIPAPLREFVTQRLPQAVVEAAQHPGPYGTGLGFVGEIVLVLLDHIDRGLLPPDAPAPARATLAKVTAAIRDGVAWTTDRTPTEISAALVPVDEPAAAFNRLLARVGQPSVEELHGLAAALGWIVPPPPGRRRRRALLPPLPEWVPFTADRVEQGVHEALCRVSEWGHDLAFRDLAGRDLTFAHGLERRTDGFRQVIGFRRDAGDLVEALADNDTLALKLQHVLWGRWNDQADGDPNQWARLDFGQLCTDLCLTRHHKGGFRSEQKAQVAAVYEAVTGLELYAEYTLPRRRELFTLRGTLWDRGVETAIHGTRGALDVAGELYWRPGQMFSDPRWRPANPFLGHISRGLLQMDLRGRWAIRLGAHYALLARRRRDTPEFRARREVVERVRLILQATALDRGYGDEPKKQQRAFEDAHDQLVEHGLLAAHGYGDRPATDWRNRDKVLCFPADLGQLNAQLRLRLPVQAGG